jgi:hypothetical protein
VKAEPVQYTGFKLFFHNDTKKGDLLLTPAEVLRLNPRRCTSSTSRARQASTGGRDAEANFSSRRASSFGPSLSPFA